MCILCLGPVHTVDIKPPRSEGNTGLGEDKTLVFNSWHVTITFSSLVSLERDSDAS